MKRKSDGARWKDHMILIRSKYAGRSVEVALLAQKVPFVFIGGTSLLQSAHVRDVLSLLRLVANPRDDIAWMRYLTLWPRVGEKTATDIIEKMSEKNTIDECIGIVSSDSKLPEAVWRAVQNVAAHAQFPAGAFKAGTTELREVLQSNYRDQNWESRERDFPLIEALAAGHGSILGFIEQYVLDPIYFSKVEQSDSDDCVTLITIHSAKGTESPVCYIAGVSAGEYPSARCAGNFDETEEERRVLYVAVTRARDELIITRPGRSTFAILQKPKEGYESFPITSHFLTSIPRAKCRRDRLRFADIPQVAPSFTRFPARIVTHFRPSPEGEVGCLDAQRCECSEPTRKASWCRSCAPKAQIGTQPATIDGQLDGQIGR